MHQRHAAAALLCTLALAGCGLTTPKIQDMGQSLPEYLDENTIVNQVKCELHLGVQRALAAKLPNGNSVEWLRQWGATVSMNLTVDEKGTLAPGLTFTSPFEEASQMFTFDVGASASSEATRREQIQFTYAFADLLAEGPIDGPCANENGVQIHSDLKIPEFIYDKAMVAQIPGSIDPTAAKGFPYSTFSDQVTFVVAVSANATPGFKLVRFAVDAKSALLSAQRTKTQDVIVTLSKIDRPATPTHAATLAPEGVDAHNAQVIGQQAGQAITNALRGQGIAVP